jgi:replicative DNA helicase
MTDLPDDFHIVPADDLEIVQVIVLAAAIHGDTQVRAQLPALQSAFEEPYRTVAGIVTQQIMAGAYIDQHVLGTALAGVRLVRRGAQGTTEQLTADQVVGLIFASQVQADQTQAYLQALQVRLQAKRQDDLKDRAVELAKSHGSNPEHLLAEFEKLVAEIRRGSASGPNAFPSEMLELIPYVQQLAKQQKGTEFLGLDSGFQHLNAICNGLYQGLIVPTAPPGRGKTTWAWQIACQTAQINQVPVLFFSMEQSKEELRAKALARLSKLQYRHILRGRLRSDDPENWGKLLEAVQQYFLISRHLTIIEGDDNTTVDTIQETAAAKLAQAGVDHCLIVLDYLQILPPRRQDTGRVLSTKDRVDLHVSALRRIARKLRSPVIAISAENRAGYRSKQLDVFKESGGIEYSADVAMILTRAKQGDAAKHADYRLLDLNIVKNRNGETGVVKYKFYPKRAEFVETGKEELVEDVEE